LILECEQYKQAHGLLLTPSVMHTTAGKLRPRIEHIIQTVGPRDVDYSDKEELQEVLTKTYYNVMKYTSETLRVSTGALPAISGGIYKVKLESVIKALHTALQRFIDEYKKTHTHLYCSFYLVNNSHAITTTAVYLFQEL